MVIRVSKLERMIREKRRAQYKKFKKVRKARDMASKYAKYQLLIGDVWTYLNDDHTIDVLHVVSKSQLAFYIWQNQADIFGYRRYSRTKNKIGFKK